MSYNPHVLSCGPDCSVCPWAAARPLAVSAASFARRVGSKHGQAPTPPTGTAAWPRRRPPHRRHLRCCVWCVVSNLARPRHRPPARPATLMKPSSPLLASALSQVKPTSSVTSGSHVDILSKYQVCCGACRDQCAKECLSMVRRRGATRLWLELSMAATCCAHFSASYHADVMR